MGILQSEPYYKNFKRQIFLQIFKQNSSRPETFLFFFALSLGTLEANFLRYSESKINIKNFRPTLMHIIKLDKSNTLAVWRFASDLTRVNHVNENIVTYFKIWRNVPVYSPMNFRINCRKFLSY